MKPTDSRWLRLMIVLLVVSVFFEGSAFSLSFLGLRLRSVQLFEVLFLGILGVLALLGKWRWRKSPLDFWLLAYLAVNFIAIFNSPWKARSLKIFLLFVSLALLYWLVFQLLRTERSISLAFFTFLTMGIAQVLFGLYQILAGALNHYLSWRLPIGHMGLVHRGYINSVWGRPYGTQVEPDFYGTICMVLVLVFLILYFSAGVMSKGRLLGGALVSMVGLYFSFVRGAWLAFFLVLLLLVVLGKKLPFYKFTWRAAVLLIGVSIGAHMFLVNTVPAIRQISQFRFSTNAPLPMTEEASGTGVTSQTEEHEDFSGKLPEPLQAGAAAAVDNASAATKSEKVSGSGENSRRDGKSDLSATAPMPETGRDTAAADNANQVKLEDFSGQVPGTETKTPVIVDRNSLLTSQNVRLYFAKLSLQSWKKSPIIGTGPGGFAYTLWQSSLGDAGARQMIAQKAFPQTNPCILFGVLSDVGLFGLILLLLIVGKIFYLSLKLSAAANVLHASRAFALLGGLLGFFLSFLITDGSWLPITWVYLGITMAYLMLATRAVEKSSRGDATGNEPCA